MSKKLVLFSIFSGLLLIISFACYPLQSDDLYMYLALGRDFFTKGSFPATDPFIYSIDQYHWPLMHHWLGILSFYAAYTIGGFDAVIIYKLIILAAIFSLPLLFVDKLKPSVILVWMLSVLVALFAMSFRLMERTSLLADLLNVAVLAVLLTEQHKPGRLKYFLPLIFLFWVNIHPSFPLGWLLLGLFSLLNLTKIKENNYQIFLALFASSILVCLINPTGLNGLLYPFSFAANQSAVYRKYYFEWMATLDPLFRFRIHNLFLMALVTMNLILLFLNRKAKPFLELALSLFFLAYGFYAIRFVGSMCFSLVLINCFLAAKIPDFKFQKKSAALLCGLLLAISAKNIFFGYDTISGPRQFGLGVDQQFVPSGGVSYINLHPEIGRVFNSHLVGNYLAWVWNGERKIFYHGFITDTDFYLKDYVTFYQSRETFDRQVSKFQIDAFLLDRFVGNELLLSILTQHPNWKLSYNDSSSLVFVRKFRAP